MNVMKKYSAFIFLLLVGCIEPYKPSGVNSVANLLVVDGFLNATEGSITVRLSRSVSLTSEDVPPVERFANVELQEENGAVIDLEEAVPGEYSASELSINTNSRYRLRIVAQGKEYASEFVPVTITPEIESIGFTPEENDLSIHVTTQDPTKNSKYYRWKTNETYTYTSPLASAFKLVGGKAVPREPHEYIYRCWRTNKIYDIRVSTSKGLSEDRISKFPITKIPRESIKISSKYSVLVQQESLTQEGYNYWLGIYKTTEDVGGLFDPLPGQIVGNISNVTDAKELVIGFFSASTVTQKRIFIGLADLPRNYSQYFAPYCDLDTVDVGDVPGLPGSTLLYNAIYAQGMPMIIGYTTSTGECLDCRSYGGVTTTPDFWE